MSSDMLETADSRIDVAILAERKEILARQINQDMLAIAMQVPVFVKRDAAGMVHRLWEVSGVGRLEASYIGNFMLQVTAVGEQVGWQQEFDLRDHYQHEYGQPTLNEQSAAKASDFDSCPEDSNFDLEAGMDKLSSLVRTIHNYYVCGQPPAEQ